MTDHALNTLLKTTPIIETTINNYSAKNIMVSISGGSDSDILIDIVTKISKDVNFVFFDTGIEYKATKEHLNYLESRYDIEIQRIKNKFTIPNIINKYGIPFMSKEISEKISRLQKHNFDFNNHDLNYNLNHFQKCKAALRWYCNDFGIKSRYNIDNKRLLKEFLIQYPPEYNISNQCCTKCKKDLAHKYIKDNDIVLSVVGIRKYEGGARNKINNCYVEKDDIKYFYPLLWFTNSDKYEYNDLYNIKNSECYTKYNLKRTGCIGCPFGDYIHELQILKRYEPKLYDMCMAIFGISYEYQNKFYEFRSQF